MLIIIHHILQNLNAPIILCIKHLNYTKEHNEQASGFKKDTITLNTPIKCSNVFNNYSNIEFSEIYAGYYYQPPKCIT